MNYETFEEVYATNDKIRERLIATVGELSDEVAQTRPDGEGWSVAEIVEHISKVDEGMCKICHKLLSKARDKGAEGDGSVFLSPEFETSINTIGSTKLNAPEMVRPGGEQSIARSLERLAENHARLNEIKELFETWNSTEEKFPHPYFGDLSAAEWLVLRGGHEARHIRQIERIIAGSNAENAIFSF